MNVEANLDRIGIQLEEAPSPVGSYLPYRITGNLVYLSGAICLRNGVLEYVGAVGGERTLEEGIEAAKRCALNQISTLKSAIGDLGRVRKVVHLAGFVWAVEGFKDSPKVINGASDLYAQAFGEAGKHSRAAVSVSGLPGGSTVEVQTVFEIT